MTGVCFFNLLPESAASEVDAAAGVGVLVVSAWLVCSESGEEVRGEVGGAELSTDVELEGGGAVTVDEDPGEEEEVDLGMGAAAAVAVAAAGASAVAGAGAAGSTEVSVVTGLSGALEFWLESPAGAAGGFDEASGRTAAPESETNNRYFVSMEKVFTKAASRPALESGHFAGGAICENTYVWVNCSTTFPAIYPR